MEIVAMALDSLRSLLVCHSPISSSREPSFRKMTMSPQAPAVCEFDEARVPGLA